jgi:hypothetical protein
VLGPPVIGTLLELLLLACGSPGSKYPVRSGTAASQHVGATCLATTVLTDLQCRAAAVACYTSTVTITARVAAGRARRQAASHASSSAAAEAAVAAGAAHTEGCRDTARHQQAAAAAVPADALLEPVLQVGPALLHLARQCNMRSAAGADQQAGMQRTLATFVEAVSDLATGCTSPAGDACTISSR